MSARDAAGLCLEGTTAVPVDLILQAVFLYRFGQKVHRTAKELGDAPLQRSQLEEVHPSSRVKFRGKVNVAVRLGLAARDRAEQRKGTQARLPQLRLVRARNVAITRSAVCMTKIVAREERGGNPLSTVT